LLGREVSGDSWSRTISGWQEATSAAARGFPTLQFSETTRSAPPRRSTARGSNPGAVQVRSELHGSSANTRTNTGHTAHAAIARRLPRRLSPRAATPMPGASQAQAGKTVIAAQESNRPA
jgi:hypothetical protein